MKDNKVTRPHMKIASSPSYTLDEIKELAREWTDEVHASIADRLTVSLLMAWLTQREREQGKGDGL